MNNTNVVTYDVKYSRNTIYFYPFIVCILAQFRETLVKEFSLTKTQINDITNFIDIA